MAIFPTFSCVSGSLPYLIACTVRPARCWAARLAAKPRDSIRTENQPDRAGGRGSHSVGPIPAHARFSLRFRVHADTMLISDFWSLLVVFYGCLGVYIEKAARHY